MPLTLRIRAPDNAAPGASLDWTVLADLAGTVDNLFLRDILGDGQTLDPARPPDLLIMSGGTTLFFGPVVPVAARDNSSGVTRIGLDIAGALRGAGLATALPDGTAVHVVLHAAADARYVTTQPLLSPLLGQGDTLDDGAALTGVQAGAAVSSAPAHAQAILPTSALAASVFAQDSRQVTYRVRLAMPLGTAQGVLIVASCPNLPAQLQWDGTQPGDPGSVPQPGHAAYGPDSTARPVPVSFAVDPDGATVRWELGDLAPMQGAAPEVLDLLLTTPLPATGPVLDATATESNSFGVVSISRAAAAPAPTQRIKVQTGILEATGSQSHFAVVGAGSGSPVSYSSRTGQFSGPVSSAAMDADPFSDRLLDVAAGDLVTFVIAVQNVAGSPAWDVVLRNTLPSGFTVPSSGADLHVTIGDGNALAVAGDLFSTTDGLHLDAGAPLAAYDARSGANVALVVFTLQATSALPAPLAVVSSQASVVSLASTANGANLLANTPVSASTELVSQGPALAIALTGTSAAATLGAQLAIGETATFHATVTLPSGRSQGVHLGALVPVGLALVSETITYATPGATGLWVGEASITGFDLGTVQAGASVRVEMDIVARAVGDAAGPVQVTLSAADPGGGGRSSAAQGTAVSAQAPGLQLLVDGPAQAQTGQTAAYTVRLSNQAGAAAAYGVQVQDMLGAGLQVVPGSVQASGPAAGATVGSSGLSAGTATLAAGETLVLTLLARVIASDGAPLGLQATATAASLPGGDPAFTLPALQAAGTAAVRNATATVTLSSPSARVGEAVAVQVLATLPAGDNPAVHVSIRLPDGTSLVPGSVQSGGGVPAAVTSNAGTVDVALGAITIPPGGGTVAVTLNILVGAVPVGTGLGFAAVVDTGYAPSPAASASLTLQDTAPTLAGLPPTVATTDDAPAAPLSGLLLADPDAGQVIQAQVQLSSPMDGALTGGSGTYDAASGRYAVSGTAAAVQAALRGLSFIPTAHQLAYGVIRTTGLSLQVADDAGGTAQAAVQVAVRGADTPPAIGGAMPGQSTTRTLAVHPLAGLTVADPDAGQVQTLQVQVSAGLGGLAGALGRYDPDTGTYTAQGTAAAVQADARALVFTPAAAGDATFSVSLNDGAGGLAQDAGTTLHIAPSADTAGVAQHFLQLPTATFLAYAGGQQTVLVGETYSGPVDYLRTQLIYDSASPAVIAAQANNAFIKSFSGFCAIQVAGGRNVVDAGPGSNFIVGGTGDDTFFLVGNSAAVTWDTVTGFHPGDMVTLFGFHPGTSTYTWADADGADGYTGRTLHADLAGDGQVTASLTFAGRTAVDAADWAVTSGTVGGVDYLAVIGLR